MPRRRPLRAAVHALACLVAAGAGGCNGESETKLYLNADGRVVEASGINPRSPKQLTVAEGRKLMAEIRKDPKRLNKLTPAERLFLKRAYVAAGKAENEEKN